MSAGAQINLENVKEVTDFGHKLQFSYQNLLCGRWQEGVWG